MGRGRGSGRALNLTMTGSDAPTAPESASSATVMQGPWPSASPPDMLAMHRPSRPRWQATVFRETASEGRALDRRTSCRIARIHSHAIHGHLGRLGIHAAIPSPLTKSVTDCGEATNRLITS